MDLLSWKETEVAARELDMEKKMVVLKKTNWTSIRPVKTGTDGVREQ